MKILLTGVYPYSQEQIKELENLGNEVIFVQNEKEKLTIDVSEIEAVVCNGLFLYNDISLFKSLKCIQLTSAGLDRVPLNYIKEHNIKLFNARGVYSIPIAEWVVGRILEVYKRNTFFYENQKSKIWGKNRNIIELSGKTVCIVGFGDIGEQIAKRLTAFDVKIISVDIVKKESPYIDKSYLTDELNEVIPQSDIIILTVPLTEKTKRMFNNKNLELIKENGILINVARGKIINQKDLIQILNKRKDIIAILDVFDEEPLGVEDELWDLDNCLITPHNCFVSDRNNARMWNIIIDNIRGYLK